MVAMAVDTHTQAEEATVMVATAVDTHTQAEEGILMQDVLPQVTVTADRMAMEVKAGILIEDTILDTGDTVMEAVLLQATRTVRPQVTVTADRTAMDVLPQAIRMVDTRTDRITADTAMTATAPPSTLTAQSPPRE